MTAPVFVDGTTPLNAATFNALGTEVNTKLAAPAVVNGQWIKGVSGAAVWSAITPADIAGYPSDATKFLRGDGTWAAPAGGVGQEVAYVERASNITINSVAESAASTIVTATAFTFDGVTAYYVQFYCASISFGGATTGGINLWMDGVDQGRLVNMSVVSEVAADYPVGTSQRRVVPSAASHTFSVRGWAGASNMVVNGSTGGAGVDMPMFIRIVKAT